MDNKENIIDRFEDMDDMYDSISAALSMCVHRWLIFIKIVMEDEQDEEMAKEIFLNMAKGELDDRYPRTFPLIERKESGEMLVQGVILKDQ